MNTRIQTDLPMKIIHISLIHVTKWNTFDKSLFCINFRIDLFETVETGKFATFVF